MQSYIRIPAIKTRSTEEKYYSSGQPIIIIGKKGKLGKAIQKICETRCLSHVLLGRQDVDICNYDEIEMMIADYNPWAIINAAGYVKIDGAESDRLNCYRDNTRGPQQLARGCRLYGIQFMTYSSDQVFDGEKGSPYLESDKVNPLNIYGCSKAKAEEFVLSMHPSSLIIRTSAFFGAWDKSNFISDLFRNIDQGLKFEASADITISPTYIPHLAGACLDLLMDEKHGIWHVANKDHLTWYEFAKKAGVHAGKDISLVVPVKGVLRAAKRPAYSVLQSEKGVLLPSLETALVDFFNQKMATLPG